MNKLSFIKVLWSPFKPFKLKLYIGRIKVGVPYFYPRKWVKATTQLAHKATMDHIKRERSYNKLNPKYARKIKPYEEIYAEKMKYQYAIPKKIGFDFVGLGWKTKWEDSDYRWEWSPVLSFVFFGYQIALKVNVNHADHYWPCWLYYERDTDKSKSQLERIQQCMEEFPQIWIRHYPDGREERTNYYELILKSKYLLTNQNK